MKIEIPEHLRADWAVWRVVKSGMATLREIESSWSIGDVLDANDVLTLHEEAEARANKKARGKR